MAGRDKDWRGAEPVASESLHQWIIHQNLASHSHLVKGLDENELTRLFHLGVSRASTVVNCCTGGALFRLPRYSALTDIHCTT